VIGGKDCDKVTSTPKNNENFNACGESIKVTALYTPCHTQDSICFYFSDPTTNEKAIFSGDTLFIGGCGRFFEGTAEEMDTALNGVLGKLPDDTQVYPGHEYTKANAKFAVTVAQDESVKSLLAFAEANAETQGKFTIGDEKKHNVFMRVRVSTAVTFVRLLSDVTAGSGDTKGNWYDRCYLDHGETSRAEERVIDFLPCSLGVICRNTVVSVFKLFLFAAQGLNCCNIDRGELRRLTTSRMNQKLSRTWSLVFESVNN
jgi:Hydroxyacylglutathione hydrolase C-terminus